MSLLVIFHRTKSVAMGLSMCLLAACGAATPSPTPPRQTVPIVTPVPVATASVPLPPLDVRQVSRGNQLYALHCATCHGAQLQGQPNWATPTVNVVLAPPLNDAGHAWDHSDAELRRSILRGSVGKDAAGNQFMPAFVDKLRMDEVEALLVFMKSTWNTQHRVRQLMLSQPR
ncbi:MAG: cytochrome c [Anaerolineae bacterium]|nr:cytochrome c [Anaerolineae bacterium]